MDSRAMQAAKEAIENGTKAAKEQYDEIMETIKSKFGEKAALMAAQVLAEERAFQHAMLTLTEFGAVMHHAAGMPKEVFEQVAKMHSTSWDEAQAGIVAAVATLLDMKHEDAKAYYALILSIGDNTMRQIVRGHAKAHEVLNAAVRDDDDDDDDDKPTGPLH